MTAPNTLPAWCLSGKLCWLGPSHRMEAAAFIHAREMRVLLPDLLELLCPHCASLGKEALVVLQNVLEHLEKTEASAITVQLVQKLCPHLDGHQAMSAALQPSPVSSTQSRPCSPGHCRDRFQQPSPASSAVSPQSISSHHTHHHAPPDGATVSEAHLFSFLPV